MRDTKICEQCGTEFKPLRSTAKYCSSSCRAKHSIENAGKVQPPALGNVPLLFDAPKIEAILTEPTKEQQAEEQPQRSAIENLRGLLDDEKQDEQPAPDEQPKMVPKIIEERKKNDSFQRQFAHTSVSLLEHDREKILQEIQACKQQIEQAMNDNPLNPFGVAALTGFLGYGIPNLFKDEDPLPPSRWLPSPKDAKKKGKKNKPLPPALPPKPDNTANWIVGGLLALLAGIGTRVYNETTKEKREREKQQAIERAQQQLQELNAKLRQIDNNLAKAKNELSGIPEWIVTRKQIMVPVPTPANNKGDKQATKTEAPKRENVVSSMDMKMKKGRRLNFQGEWERFFGQPSILFHCVIHGLPGEGKSTLAIMLAKYLAENFGMVLYISAEERKDDTILMKIERLQARSAYLDFPEPDILKFEDIKARYKPGVYNFIFIDSLSYLYIDTERLRELKETFKDSAFITISMSTKDGKMRGSQEIAHDADIVVHVEKGIATTTKNRFKAKDQVFKIFDTEDGEGVKVIPINPPRNVV